MNANKMSMKSKTNGIKSKSLPTQERGNLFFNQDFWLPNQNKSSPRPRIWKPLEQELNKLWEKLNQ